MNRHGRIQNVAFMSMLILKGVESESAMHFLFHIIYVRSTRNKKHVDLIENNIHINETCVIRPFYIQKKTLNYMYKPCIYYHVPLGD